MPEVESSSGLIYELLADRIVKSNVLKEIKSEIEMYPDLFGDLSDEEKVIVAVEELFLDWEKMLNSFPEIWQMLRNDFLGEANSRCADVKTWFSKALVWDIYEWFDRWTSNFEGKILEILKQRIIR